MKFLLALLIVVNVALYGAWHGWLGRDLQALVVPEQREPERLALQVAANKLVVIADARSDTPAATPVPPPVASTTVATLACIELSPMPVDDARKLNDRLGTLGSDVKATQRPAPEAVSYIVYLPPYPSKADADRAVNDLKSKGVDDLLVITDIAALRNGISLGIFRSEDAAKSRIAALSSRSIPRAQISARPSVPRSIIEVRDLPLTTRATLEQQARDAGAGEWHDCTARKA